MVDGNAGMSPPERCSVLHGRTPNSEGSRSSRWGRSWGRVDNSRIGCVGVVLDISQCDVRLTTGRLIGGAASRVWLGGGGPSERRHRPPLGTRRQEIEEASRALGGKAGKRRDLLDRRVTDALYAPECLQQRTTLRRSDPRNAEQLRR